MQGRAQSVHIRLGRGLALILFGRRIARCADECAAFVGLKQLGDAEIHHFDTARCAFNHDIGWLDIAVNQAPLVQIIQHIRDLIRPTQHRSFIKPAFRLATQQIFQVIAFDKIHRQIIAPAVEKIGVHAGNLRVIKPAQNRRFFFKPRYRFITLFWVGETVNQRFEGIPATSIIGSFIHRAHAAFFDRSHNSIAIIEPNIIAALLTKSSISAVTCVTNRA